MGWASLIASIISVLSWFSKLWDRWVIRSEATTEIELDQYKRREKRRKQSDEIENADPGSDSDILNGL